MRSTLISLFVCSGFALVGTGCISQEKYDDLLTAYRNQEQQLLGAQNDLATSRANEAELRRQLLAAAADLEQFKSLNASGKGDLDKLLRDYQALLDRVGNLNVGPLPPALNQALADLASKYPDILSFDERTGMLRFASDFTFDSGKAELKAGTSELLSRLAGILNSPEARQFEVKIVGHTDNQPIKSSVKEHPTNMHLSAHRAITVRDALLRDGVAAVRMQVAGYGEFRPIVTNGAKGAAQNRRVEIFLTPLVVPIVDAGAAPDSTPAAKPSGVSSVKKPHDAHDGEPTK